MSVGLCGCVGMCGCVGCVGMWVGVGLNVRVWVDKYMFVYVCPEATFCFSSI